EALRRILATVGGDLDHLVAGDQIDVRAPRGPREGIAVRLRLADQVPIPVLIAPAVGIAPTVTASAVMVDHQGPALDLQVGKGVSKGASGGLGDDEFRGRGAQLITVRGLE